MEMKIRCLLIMILLLCSVAFGAKTELQSQWLGGSLQLVGSDIVGNAYYVDSSNGSSSNGGTSWTNAMATLDKAIAKATANNGDVIYLAPYHTESESTAATSIATLSKAGVSVIGIVQGNQRPTFTLSAADATFSVTAGNCSIEGIKIISGIADCAVGLTASATADGLSVRNCVFSDGGTAILELVIGVSVAAACTDVTIEGCFFDTFPAGSSTASAIKAVGAADRLKIIGNVMLGDWNTAGIDAVTAASVDVYIADNVINNLDAAAGLAISCKSDTTGAVVRNLLHGGKDGTSPIAAAACLVAENYGTNAEGASGIILPAVDS